MAGDCKRAPCHGAASQLSAASSNTLVPPLIRPYPSSPKTLRKCRPHPFVGRVSADKRHIGLAEREIHMPVYGYYIFPKPSVQGFPTCVDPADRSCRYLI
jgi:hypothetical protein